MFSQINKYYISIIIVLISLFYSIYYLTDISRTHYSSTITSDGEGYYAYLPAIYLLKDKSFQKNADVKFQHTGNKDDYMIRTKNGMYVNKYFGGVSFMATPAFATITLLQKITGEQPDGYNVPYFLGMFIYSMLLFFIGFFLYKRTITSYYGISHAQEWIFLVVILVSPWLFFAINHVVYANNYLFICFSIVLWLLIKIQNHPAHRAFLYVFFFLLGVISIVRPTSLIITLIIPFFFPDFNAFIQYLKKYVLKRNTFSISIAFYLIPIAYQFFLWKWETGSFFLWSYSGEGFNWLKPQFTEVLFGYRNGILFHSPILFFCLGYVLFTFRKKPYKSTIYLIYFAAITYISASWWCYDFETKYGLRNFNEHYVFLLLPLFDFVRNINKQKWTYFILVPITLLPLIRFNQFMFGYNTNQRFTAASYWLSLEFWKKENKQRWMFCKSVPPFGTRVSSNMVIQEKSITIRPEEEFYLTQDIPVQLKPGERVYFIVKFDRDFEGKNNLPPVFVTDHYNTYNEQLRYYSAIPCYEDKLKEKEHVEIDDHRFDNREEMNMIRIYFWNLNHVSGKLTNVTVEVQKFKP